VADTNRFNRDSGVPAVELRATGENARRRLRLRRLGVAIEWEEEPFEWVRPRRFSVVRRFLKGPVREMRIAAELEPRESGGTRLVYEVQATPRNVLGLLAIPVQVGFLSRRRFDAAFRDYDRRAAAGVPAPPAPVAGRPAKLAPGGRERLQASTASLRAAGVDEELVNRLARLIERADDLDLAAIRPYALAAEWGMSRRVVLEACLHATRAGLLEFRWNLLCPLCRGPAESESTLGDVGSRVHCDTCRIDFDVDFDRSVELLFRPSPAVRPVERTEFCVGGPQLTPHVLAQQLLAPGEERSLAPVLEPGRYRLRTLALPGSQSISVESGGATEAELTVDGDGVPRPELKLERTPALRLANATDSEQLFVLERTAWSDQAATAAEVTSLQVFRDLFSAEALRPGEPLSVGSLTVAFTDLRDSTRFYREVGDAPAFGSVLQHLDVLRECVTANEGAVVKAMGDAIMAVFPRPVGAVRGLIAAQQAVAEPAEGRPPLALKVGIHAGPCIAINQGGRLDYFGSTVNLAARLVGLSTGDDIVVSGAVLADPEIAEVVRDLRVEPAAGTLKGFEGESFELWRLSP
jgi:class 3 adenylate cyclase